MPSAAPVDAIALIPLRGGGKSRLDGALGATLRSGLVAAMLGDVVAALSAGGVPDVRVLAGDRAAEELAARHGLPAVADPASPSRAGSGGEARLRAAVDTGLAAVPSDTTRLIVAADLPRLSAAEVAMVLTDPADVVVVPTAGGGTAVLRLAPGVMVAAQYGIGSGGAHLRAAESTGHSAVLLDLPGARHDVDAATDLAALIGPLDGAMPGPATAAFLAGLGG